MVPQFERSATAPNPASHQTWQQGGDEDLQLLKSSAPAPYAYSPKVWPQDVGQEFGPLQGHTLENDAV